MMTQEDQRAYSRGYAAGRKRQTLERTVENVRRERQAFLDKAFLALLPTAMTQNSWKFGDKIVSTVEDRVKLASYWAKEALHKRPLV